MRTIAAWAAVAAAAGYVSVVLCAAAGANPLVAAAGLVIVTAAFGWTRRDGDVLDVAFPSFLVAYAAFAGFALARVPHITIKAPPQSRNLGPYTNIGALSDRWPVVLFGGVIVALILMVAVALPVSLIPVRRKRDPHAHDRFWNVVRERNALRDGPAGGTPPPR